MKLFGVLSKYNYLFFYLFRNQLKLAAHQNGKAMVSVMMETTILDVTMMEVKILLQLIQKCTYMAFYLHFNYTGDCCGDDVDKSYCTACACIDPAICKNNYGDSSCQYWASNYCTGHYQDWMKENCFKACNYC